MKSKKTDTPHRFICRTAKKKNRNAIGWILLTIFFPFMLAPAVALIISRLRALPPPYELDLDDGLPFIEKTRPTWGSFRDSIRNTMGAWRRKLQIRLLWNISGDDAMNIPQRILLIIAAIALIWVIWTTPQITIVQGTYFNAEVWGKENARFAKMTDYRTALTRAVGIAGGTLLIFFALMGIKKKDV